jgi:hypothetical protein
MLQLYRCLGNFLLRRSGKTFVAEMFQYDIFGSDKQMFGNHIVLRPAGFYHAGRRLRIFSGPGN